MIKEFNRNYKKADFHSYCYTKRDSLVSTSEDEFNKIVTELEANAQECDKFNRELWSVVQKSFDEWVVLGKQFFGDSRKFNNLVKEFKAPLCFYQHSDCSSFLGEIKRERNKIVEDIKAKSLVEESKNLKNLAVKFLLERNLVAGRDYEIDDAIKFANETCWEELYKEKTSVPGAYPFNGMNCDEECSWDGVSKRCNCGNHRVCWDYEGDFRDMTLVGEAY